MISGGQTTIGFITNLRPLIFVPMFESVGEINFKHHGPRPPFADLAIGVTPVLDSVAPMSGEAGTRAPAWSNDDATATGANLTQTVCSGFLFYRNADFSLNQVPWAFGNSGGAASARFQNIGTDAVAVLWDDGPNRYLSQLDPTEGLSTNVWHMTAWRQPANSDGVNWFHDGTFYANSDAAVTDSLTGVATNNYSFADVNIVAGADRFALGRQADTGGANPYTGDFFHLMIDDRLWTDTEIQNLWDLAIVNGLNSV